MDKCTVLVIDDSLVVQESLKQILRDEYNLLFAKSGEEGIALANKSMPDIILLDVIMPHLDGFGVMNEIRNSSKTMNIPIIMLTSISDKNCEANGLMAGASDYIQKPIDSLVVKLRVGIQARTLGYVRKIDKMSAEIAALKAEVAALKADSASQTGK